MARAIYDASLFVALSVATWYLERAGEAVRAMQRRLPTPERQQSAGSRSKGRAKARKKSPSSATRRVPERRRQATA
jgi:hypothetical protein